MNTKSRVLIAGSSGFIGSSLADYLISQDYDVSRLSRTKPDPAKKIFFWDPARRSIDIDPSEPFDFLINLCGENIAAGRWTKKRKHLLLESRIQSTHLLVKHAKKLCKPGATFLNASALGFYGNRPSEDLNEEAPAGSGFLAGLCKEWETAALCAKEENLRVVTLRFAAVLSKKGGMLRKLLPVFSLGLGGRLGPGTQYMSWIALQDACRAIEHCIKTKEIEGPVNIAAPNPVMNIDFTHTLAQSLHRPAMLPVPSLALRLAFGEMADELLLSSTRAYPAKLLKNGFKFQWEELTKDLILSS